VLNAVSKSPDDTRDLAAAVAPLVASGDIVLLSGDLAAGKTTFTQGFARGLGVDDVVTSPTFVLMHPYEGRLRLLHLDLYRLEHLQEVIDLGLLELVEEGGVALIEWGDVAAPVFHTDYLSIDLGFGAAVDERVLRIQPVGQRWTAAHESLRTAVGRWLT
jgi:tRNA threonylcarbamoyladenosine biosynthesis protein TsaE